MCSEALCIPCSEPLPVLRAPICIQCSPCTAGAHFTSCVAQVYEVFLPADVRAVLQQLRIIISLGIEGVPLACIGADGYVRRLLLWTVGPLVLVALIIIANVLNEAVRRRTCISLGTLFRRVTPSVLRLAFLVYPIVTNVAFEAYSCFTFEDGRSWLITDVAIECNTPPHDEARALASLAITIYPVGLFLLNALLLFCARTAILSAQPTALSRSLSFLHSEYEPNFFWWELMEMGRRFVLVGLLVVWPFAQGSIMQLATANLVSMVYLALQVQVDT